MLNQMVSLNTRRIEAKSGLRTVICVPYGAGDRATQVRSLSTGLNPSQIRFDFIIIK
jgi:hypothetical protein